jgi:putative phage-type endonuclease
MKKRNSKMRKIDFEQGSQEWLDWRQDIITATDAAVIMENSLYATPYQLWQRKLGEAPEQFVNAAMIRGRDAEPIAREMFIKEYEIHMEPACIESEQYNFLGASLDGISSCNRYLLEIKSQSIEKIKFKGIPDMHYDQMQHQMLCTDGAAELCYYVTIWDDEIYTIPVYPDIEWQEKYIPKAKDFWTGLVFREKPAMANKDYSDMASRGNWAAIAQDYRQLTLQIKAMQELQNVCKTELIKLCNNQSGSGAGVKVLKKESNGRVDYERVCHDWKITEDDLEKYRKEKGESWMVTIE